LAVVGRPELKNFLRFIDGNSIPNCPITHQDAINAHAIFGRDIGSIKEKTTRRKLEGIRGNIANISKEITEQYHQVITLCIDIMFVNKIPIFLTISRNIRFITATVLENSLKLYRRYTECIPDNKHSRGFRIRVYPRHSRERTTIRAKHLWGRRARTRHRTWQPQTCMELSCNQK
jgi:hypothetical protein